MVEKVKLEDLQAATRQIFRPYQVDFAETYWWSAYSIGQRLADHFSKANRVFLTGDACHTHSPKAGQGMNVSLQDVYNIGWKLASILKGQTGPELLKTYIIERQRTAEILINWDKVWSKQIGSMGKDAGGVLDADGHIDFSEIFVKAEAFTAGLTVAYDSSPITGEREQPTISGKSHRWDAISEYTGGTILRCISNAASQGSAFGRTLENYGFCRRNPSGCSFQKIESG